VQVPYNTNGWLDKNKDPINECVVQLMQSSKEPLVAAFFKEPEDGIKMFQFLTLFSTRDDVIVT
jgi:myosin heavy subunit